MVRMGQSTRDRLIKAAIDLLWKQSYQGTSVDELCSQAETRKGSFYHFFRSKTELAVAAIETAWEHTEQAVFAPIFQSDEEGMTQLQHLIDKVDEVQSSILTRRGTYFGCPFGNLGQEMANRDEQIRGTIQKVFDLHCEYIESALHKAEASGDIPRGDAAQRARNVFALLEGALLLAKVANDPARFRDIASSIRTVAAA